MRTAALALRFALELAALAAFAWWGAHAGGSTAGRIALGLAAPLAAAVAWGRLAAPRSARRLRGPQRLVFEVAFFGLAAFGLAASGEVGAGLLLAVLTGADLAVLRVVGETEW